MIRGTPSLVMGVGFGALVLATVVSLQRGPGGPVRPAVTVSDVPRQASGESEAVRTWTRPQEIRADSLVELTTHGDSETFGRIGSLAYVGGVLFVGDVYGPTHVTAIDVQSGRILGGVGRHGEGPAEFQSPASMSLTEGPRPAVWVHDFYNRRLTRVEADVGTSTITIGSTIPLLVETTTEDAVRLDDGRLWSAGLYGEDAVLMLFDSDGKALSKTGTPPFALEDVGHRNGVRLVNRANMVANRSRSRLAVAFYSANRVDIYDTAGRLIATGSGPREITAAFYVEDDRFFWDRDRNMLAYTQLAPSRVGVFALFCDCLMSEERPTDRTLIHEFTWDGEFQRELRLPYAARRIAANDDGTRFFTAVDEPWPRVVEWSVQER